MDVLHVVINISGTTIPVEIASRLDQLSHVNSKIASQEPPQDPLPDTVNEEQILIRHCDVTDYESFVDAAASEFDIVHTHHIGPAAKVGLHALRQPIYHINTQHGHVHYTPEETIKNIPGLLFSDLIIYNSITTSGSYNFIEKVCKFRADEFIVHNGVDVDRIEPYRATIDDPTTVVTAAQLIPRKNLGSLIKGIAHTEELNLRIIGDGPLNNRLKRVASEVGVTDRVEFTGYLPHRRDVYSEFSEADIFAIPSHGEGFCVAVAEAMAVGLPVVVSNIQIFHEVVGETGVFVDRNSPETIGSALSELRKDPELAKVLGRRNRERILDKFTLEQCVNGYRSVYRKLLE